MIQCRRQRGAAETASAFCVGQVTKKKVTDDFYHSAAYKRWREAVLRRDKYLCQICKRYGRTDADGLPVRGNVAHHIKTVEEHPELRLRVENGMCICEKCHNRIHPEKPKNWR